MSETADTPRFLITNDDGIHADGIRALAEAAETLGEVVIVAPDRERSSIGHAITLRSPVRVTALTENRFAVSGTPSDCVYMGIHFICDRRPTMVLSGINHGANLGDDVTYSGTVGAAMEGVIQGVPSVAFSLVSGHDFSACKPHLITLLQHLLAQPTLPADLLLNVNLPDCSGNVGPFRLGGLGPRHYGKVVERRRDPRGGTYFWIGGPIVKHRDEPGSDEQVVHGGEISVTPLTLDITHQRHWGLLSDWELFDR